MFLTHAPIEKGQVSDQNWKEKQKKRQVSQGKEKEEAWLWVGPLETLPVCKKDKIKSAGQLQMLHERQQTCKNKAVQKESAYFISEAGP